MSPASPATASDRVPLTIVFGFRDRDLERVRRSLDSLAEQTFSSFRVVLVDYGSGAETIKETRQLVESYSFCEYVYSDSRGLPWNRSHALNTGVRRAESDFVMTTDVDMIFPPDFLTVVMDRASAESALYCYNHFLPEGFSDWHRLGETAHYLRPAGRAARGGCQVVAAEIFRRLGGFDEYYRYWGLEDHDFHWRLMQAGLREIWLNDRTTLYHQWHPPLDWQTAGFMPDSWWPRVQSYFHRSKEQLVRNPDGWGELLRPEDRPVFTFLDFDNHRLRVDERLIHFNRRCDSNREAGNLVTTFWELPPGHALAVHGAAFPERRPWVDGVLRLANAFLRRTGSPTRVGYPSNVVHSYLAELTERTENLIADLYLGFPAEGGISLLVRAPAPEVKP